jgi:hypothetical protein
MRKVSTRALEPKNHLGAVPQRKEKLFFKPFPNILDLQWHAFTAKLNRTDGAN